LFDLTEIVDYPIKSCHGTLILSNQNLQNLQNRLLRSSQWQSP